MTNAELIERIQENYQVNPNSILDVAISRLKTAEKMGEALKAVVVVYQLGDIKQALAEWNNY